MNNLSPTPWNRQSGCPWNLLDATGCRIAWFNGDDYHSDSTATDAANLAHVLELRDTLRAAYEHFIIRDPEQATVMELREMEQRMRRVLETAGVLEQR